MAKYKPQHSRLLFIDRKLNEGRYPNCRTLAEEWEVSRKTIQRDLDYMRYQLDAPIEYSSNKRGYYYTEQNFKLPAISIKESDLFAIYLAEKVLELGGKLGGRYHVHGRPEAVDLVRQLVQGTPGILVGALHFIELVRESGGHGLRCGRGRGAPGPSS